MKIHKKSLIFLLIAILLIVAFLLQGGYFALAEEGKHPLDGAEQESAFGAGQGTLWPEAVFAPFVDITAWVTNKKYSLGGSLDLAKVYKDTGVLYYNLGFIAYNRLNAFANGAYGKMLNWCFGGYPELSEQSKSRQYQGIKSSIISIREQGGDIALSIGGGVEGSNFFQRTQDITILRNTYLDIVNGFGLTRLDLDIEGSGQNKEGNIANAKAIKQVQELTGVQITLTLPADPNGLSNLGLQVLDAYLLQGVELTVVNAMAMCYGTKTLENGESYGEAAVRAGENVKAQLQAHYLAKREIVLSEEQAYAKVGTTISIGYQSASFPIFTPEWAKLMYDWAKGNKIGMLSFWSLNRDSKTQANKGVAKQYECTGIYKEYTAVKVTFQTSGGSELEPVLLPYGTLGAELPAPSKQGAFFSGWFVDKELSIPVSVFTENQTIYAKWVSNVSEQEPQIPPETLLPSQDEPATESAKTPLLFYIIPIIFIIAPFWLAKILKGIKALSF